MWNKRKPCNELQRAEECTDHGDRCRPVDAVQRRDSMSSGGIQGISRSWLQHSANTPTRATSEVDWPCTGMFIYAQVMFTGNFMDCTCTQYCSVALIDSVYLLTCVFGCMQVTDPPCEQTSVEDGLNVLKPFN